MTIKNEKYINGYCGVDAPCHQLDVEFYDGENYATLPSGKRETLEKAINEAHALRQVIDNQERELIAWRSRFPEYTYDAQSGIISYRAFLNKEEDI